MRILIVEDDPLVALTAAAALMDAGHQVIGPAYGPEEAWTLASEDTPDLALVDINLAGHNEGLALARAFLDKLGLASIYVSGQIVAAREHRAALGLLKKPYDPDSLPAVADAANAVIHGDRPSRRLPAALELFASLPSGA